MVNSRRNVVELFEKVGIKPSAQRISVADYVLFTEEHPSAEQVFARTAASLPMISRATVYNTLNLLVEKGLLRPLVIEEGHVVFDPHIETHHHFLETGSGKITDLPDSALKVMMGPELAALDVESIQVVVRGRHRRVGKLFSPPTTN